MKVVFFGSGAFGLPTLEALCREHEVGLVVSQPDRPAGRGRQEVPTPVAQWAAERGITVLKPDRVNKGDVLRAVEFYGPAANVVVAFGQKIGPQLIASPALGAAATINLHASLLPAWRGAAPVNWAILGGDTVTGNTVFSLVEQMDAGDILGRQTTPIDPLETAGELHDRLSAMGPELVLQVLARLKQGLKQGEKQDERKATAAPKLSRENARAHWNHPAARMRCHIHGLTPWPGVRVRLIRPGMKDLPLLVRRVAESRTREWQTPGTLLAGGRVCCAEGSGLDLLEVQPEGRRQMAWRQFECGQAIPEGSRFSEIV